MPPAALDPTPTVRAQAFGHNLDRFGFGFGQPAADVFRRQLSLDPSGRASGMSCASFAVKSALLFHHGDGRRQRGDHVSGLERVAGPYFQLLEERRRHIIDEYQNAASRGRRSEDFRSVCCYLARVEGEQPQVDSLAGLRHKDCERLARRGSEFRLGSGRPIPTSDHVDGISSRSHFKPHWTNARRSLRSAGEDHALGGNGTSFACRRDFSQRPGRIFPRRVGLSL